MACESDAQCAWCGRVRSKITEHMRQVELAGRRAPDQAATGAPPAATGGPAAPAASGAEEKTAPDVARQQPVAQLDASAGDQAAAATALPSNGTLGMSFLETCTKSWQTS